MADTGQSINKRVGTAALIVSGGVLLSRILGQVREIIFASFLGASGITDQYVAAFRIPDFLNYLLAGGFLSITFIPIFARYLADDDEEGGWRALSAIFRPIMLGITAFVVIGWFAAPTVVNQLYPDFSASQIDATIRLTRIVLPAQIFFVGGALLSAVQYAKGQFAIPTLAPIVYNLAIIIGGLADAVLTDEAGPEGFIWGALVGAIIGNFGLQYFGARRVGLQWIGGTSWSHPAIKEYIKIALPLMIGQSIVVLDETFMSVFGNQVGEAAQTHLQYARRTMLVPVGAVAQAAGVAAYPYLARLFAQRDLKAMGATVDRALSYVVVLSLGAAALMIALTESIMRVLFERGAFGAADTLASARALLFYALAIPIWGALQIVTRAFYAKKDMWSPVVIGTVATVIAIPIYIVAQRRFGLEGVAIASTLSLALYTTALVLTWYRNPDNHGDLTRIGGRIARTLPLAAVGGTGAFLTARLATNTLGATWTASFIALIAGLVVFVGIVLALGGALYEWRGAPHLEGDPPGTR